jgi:hypothetical protein
MLVSDLLSREWITVAVFTFNGVRSNGPTADGTSEERLLTVRCGSGAGGEPRVPSSASNGAQIDFCPLLPRQTNTPINENRGRTEKEGHHFHVAVGLLSLVAVPALCRCLDLLFLLHIVVHPDLALLCLGGCKLFGAELVASGSLRSSTLSAVDLRAPTGTVVASQQRERRRHTSRRRDSCRACQPCARRRHTARSRGRCTHRPCGDP